MRYLIFGLTAFLVGFIAAIPVGANQIEVARRAINGHIPAAMMVVLGGTVSDLLYGIIAFFGIRTFLRDPLVESIFWLVNGAILIGLGIYTIRHSGAAEKMDRKGTQAMENLRIAFATGFMLAIMNPLMISWWLIGADLLEDAGMMTPDDRMWEMAFLIIAGVGLASYSVLLVVIAKRVKRAMSPRAVRNVTVAFGIVLLALAGYFIVRSTVRLADPARRAAGPAVSVTCPFSGPGEAAALISSPVRRIFF